MIQSEFEFLKGEYLIESNPNDGILPVIALAQIRGFRFILLLNKLNWPVNPAFTIAPNPPPTYDVSSWVEMLE